MSFRTPLDTVAILSGLLFYPMFSDCAHYLKGYFYVLFLFRFISVGHAQETHETTVKITDILGIL